MDDDALFSWLHLSDIHVGHGDAGHGWDQKLVMRRLQEDVAGARARKTPAPDVILVTGDIAFSGAGRSATEYEEARAWLLALGKAVGVPAERIFLVPGNHDVNRAADKDRDTRRLVEQLRSGSDDIDEALGHAGDRAKLASRMGAYLDFAKGFAPVDDGLYWTRSLDAREGLSVRLVGLNTALLSASDDDQGKLRLGKAQIDRGLREPAREGELIVVLSHHPLRSGWLADEKEVDGWIKSSAHVHLSGHVHEADFEFAGSGSGKSLLRVVAGSVHGEKNGPDVPAGHGYSFGAVLRGEGGKAVLRVFPRKWSDRKKEFQLDVDNVPAEPSFAEHALPIKLPAPSAAPVASAPVASVAVASATQAAAGTAPRPASSGPVEVYISYAPEDEALKKKLETHLVMLKRNGMLRYTSHATAAGEDVEKAAAAGLSSARLILLLISPEYVASEYAYEVELDIAQRRYDAGEATVVPVLLRPFKMAELRSKDDGSKAWFERLQRLPRDGVAVSKWADADEALMKIAAEIEAVVAKIRGA